MSFTSPSIEHQVGGTSILRLFRRKGRSQWEVVIVLKCGDLRSGAPRTIPILYVGGGQGTETEGFLDRVLKARAGMKGGKGKEGVGGIG